MEGIIAFVALPISVLIFAIIVRYIEYLEYKEKLRYKKNKPVKQTDKKPKSNFYYETKTYTPVSKGKVNKC